MMLKDGITTWSLLYEGNSVPGTTITPNVNYQHSDNVQSGLAAPHVKPLIRIEITFLSSGVWRLR